MKIWNHLSTAAAFNPYRKSSLCCKSSSVLPALLQKKFIFALIICISALGPTKAQAQLKYTTKPSSMYRIARDGTGRIWGACSDQDKALYTWQGGQWRKTDFAPPGNFTPMRLVRRPNGAVICLWRSEGRSEGRSEQTGAQVENGTASSAPTAKVSENYKDYKVSEHQGQSSRFIAAFAAELEDNPVLIATKDDVWLTDRGRSIYRVEETRPFKPVYKLEASQLFRVSKLENYKTETNPLRAVIDGQGHLWFFSDVWSKGSSAYMLRGALTWDGKQFTHHPHLFDALHHRLSPPSRQSAKSSKTIKSPTVVDTLAFKDASHLWLALADSGLYEFDIRSLQARHIAEPRPKAFENIQQITAEGGDWHIVAGSRWGDNDRYDESVSTGELWRLHGEKWRLLHSGLDKAGDGLWSGPQESPRPFLQTSQGLWVGAFGGGAWFLPFSKTTVSKAGNQSQARQKEKSPPDFERAIAVDWRRGLRFHTAHALFALGQGQILVDSSYGTAIITDSRALLSRNASSRVSTFRTYCDLVQAGNGHLWGPLSLRGNALNEWDGERWLRYPTPRSYDLNWAGECAMDSKGRVWLLSGGSDRQTAIFDPNSKSWQVFDNYRAALRAQQSKVGKRNILALGPDFNRVQSRTRRSPYQVADFTTDGRICYRGGAGELWYFDGKIWRHWTRRQISNEPVTAYRYFESAPFFDRSGTLSVNIENKTWKRSAAGWKSFAHESDPRPAAEHHDPTSAAPPPGTSFVDTSGNSRMDSSIRDGKGFVWIVSQRQLYKTAPGLQAAQFSPGENHPFIDARFFNQVFVDNKGNTFFATAYGYTEYVMVSGGAPPDTKVKVTANAVDSFTFDFSSAVSGQKWFQWRMDDGPWNTPQSTPRVRQDAIPGGKHKIEVAALDKNLLVDPSPAIVSFSVNIDPAKQVAALIADLSSPDYALREAAVTGLARQPARALPSLRAARAKATWSTQWWIDAAIQQIERDASGKNEGRSLGVKTK